MCAEKSRAMVFTIDGEKPTAKGIISDSEPKQYSFDEVIDIIGFGRTTLQVFIASSIVMMAVLNETMGISIVIPAAQCDLNLSSTDKGILSGVSFGGIIVSSHFWGYIADTKGRRSTLIVSLLLTATCALVSSFSINFTMMAVMRFLVGIFISAPSATIFAYLGEFFKTENRTMVITYASVAVGLSGVFTATTGWYVLSFDWSLTLPSMNFIMHPWRLLFIVYTLPTLVGACWLIVLPESPKFYLSRGRQSEAFVVLQRLYLENHPNATAQDFDVKHIIPETGQKSRSTLSASTGGFWQIVKSVYNQTVPLFKRPNLVNFVICCVVQFGLFVVSAGMGLWFPDIVNRITTSNATDVTVCEALGSSSSYQNVTESYEEFISRDAACNNTVNERVFIYAITLGGLYTILYLVMSIFMRIVGRKCVVGFNLFFSGFSGIVLQFVGNPYIMVSLFCSFLVFAGTSISILNGATVSMFPTNVRAMAVCLSLMMGRLGSVFGSNLVGLIMEQNCTLTFYLFASGSIICAALTLMLPS
ncbi:synaptic vesicle glycoprotein 2B isoform X2 [Anopheles cruzii]|uniref:synaptic vesicle glycoprotein 2B isoform X2 n=1 Tax=Anopheles cruzii TaxID=68878 RepID=UPI0022EC5071|nr:synaptic vesicle glycoprotein 2B isoform X2 [Anopheles cruzii]